MKAPTHVNAFYVYFPLLELCVNDCVFVATSLCCETVGAVGFWFLRTLPYLSLIVQLGVDQYTSGNILDRLVGLPAFNVLFMYVANSQRSACWWSVTCREIRDATLSKQCLAVTCKKLRIAIVGTLFLNERHVLVSTNVADDHRFEGRERSGSIA